MTVRSRLARPFQTPGSAIGELTVVNVRPTRCAYSQIGVQPPYPTLTHNSHLGDARATEMGQRGELNVGQLVREKYGRDAVLVGFTTHHGMVTAASDC